jgi:MoaA/NifB/PqqE/SkfB family radical SAM enzyme
MRTNDAPPLVIWETSQACDLACSNCRASAAPRRQSTELTTAEGIRLLGQIRSFGNPLMVFTVCDPLKRPDLFTLIRKSVALGLRTNVSASATSLVTREVIQEFKNAGVERMAIGLDDISGASSGAMNALETALEVGLDTQVQTAVTSSNMHLLCEIAEFIERVKARAWSLALAGDESEKVFRNIYEISQRASFEVKTEDLRYRRYLARRLERLGEVAEPIVHGISGTRGFVFVSHTGEIHPSGFLSISAGNVRHDSLCDVYCNSSLFSILCASFGTTGTAANGNNPKYADVRGLALML